MKWGRFSRRRVAAAVVILAAIAIAVWVNSGPQSGHILDEARLANRAAASFPAAGEDYFKDMDGGVTLSPDEVKGRNTWIVWTGGNDRFWDQLVNASMGTFDLLKILSSYPGLKFNRDTRWDYFGLVSEPCFEKPTAPNPQRFGLWIDTRSADCPADPFENEQKYPGVKIGARGKNMPVGSFYGYASGIVGLRLFPNPAFDETAQKAWDPVRYYTDPSYYNNKELVRPYRVGMACGFCHVGPDPVRPPADAEHPKWSNLSSSVGAQYFWVDRIFTWLANPRDYVFQLMHTSRPGALDTSLITTDYINNPRTMNAVYNFSARMQVALRNGKETLAGGGLDNKQLNDYIESGPLTKFYEKPVTVWTPRVLKDGADSVGALAALNRVYINIGLFSEEWMTHFQALTGGKVISPMRVSVARKNSSYWEATEAQSVDMGQFFFKASTPHRLADAPGGTEYLKADPATLDRGKVVFAETCARCHSSKAPEPPSEANPGACKGSEYLTCWNKYWAWTKTDDFKSKMRAIVAKPDFLDENFLSTDLRVPSSLLQTNACSPLATNAIQNHIWEDFSSQTYKDLPSVGQITVHSPITGKAWQYTMPAGGRGYTRSASLVSMWSTAPFLLNNSVGRFEPEPSVEARMRSFDDSIRKMLWPERREQDAKFGGEMKGTVDRLPEPAYLSVPIGYLPGVVQSTIGFWSWLLPDLFVSAERTEDITASTTTGSNQLTDVRAPSPLTTFSAGAAIEGPGLAPGARVVIFDGASRTLTVDRAATGDGRNVSLRATVAEAGVKFGPVPAGTPVNLFMGIELASETPGLLDRVKHNMSLLSGIFSVALDWNSYRKASDGPERDKIYERLQTTLLSMNKCPDFVVNRGHYFGTSQFGEEPGLSDADKEALIAFLKTF